jgi:hypothetical protein
MAQVQYPDRVLGTDPDPDLVQMDRTPGWDREPPDMDRALPEADRAPGMERALPDMDQAQDMDPDLRDTGQAPRACAALRRERGF